MTAPSRSTTTSTATKMTTRWLVSVTTARAAFTYGTIDRLSWSRWRLNSFLHHTHTHTHSRRLHCDNAIDIRHAAETKHSCVLANRFQSVAALWLSMCNYSSNKSSFISGRKMPIESLKTKNDNPWRGGRHYKSPWLICDFSRVSCFLFFVLSHCIRPQGVLFFQVVLTFKICMVFCSISLSCFCLTMFRLCNDVYNLAAIN